VLGRFIADFYAPAPRLVVEVDGVCHARRVSVDVRRDRALERAGYHVVRLDAELVRRDLDAAVAIVAAEVSAFRAAL
jgi:very-short-patch-repair endonuclease